MLVEKQKKCKRESRPEPLFFYFRRNEKTSIRPIASSLSIPIHILINLLIIHVLSGDRGLCSPGWPVHVGEPGKIKYQKKGFGRNRGRGNRTPVYGFGDHRNTFIPSPYKKNGRNISAPAPKWFRMVSGHRYPGLQPGALPSELRNRTKERRERFRSRRPFSLRYCCAAASASAAALAASLASLSLWHCSS